MNYLLLPLLKIKQNSISYLFLHYYLLILFVGVSRPGVPKPTSEVSPRAPAQMGRREAEREGGKRGGRRRA
jgi:hypothetical protein